MATFAVPISRRLFALPEAVANSWNRRKSRRNENCPLCSTELHKDIGRMIRAGFYQPAVAASRLRVELIVVDYYRKAVCRLPDGVIPVGIRSVSLILLHMQRAGEISLRLRRRIESFYSRASTAVHGNVECTRLLARDMEAEAEAIAVAIRKGGAR